MAIVEQLKRLRFENNHLDRAVEARRLVSRTWNSIYVCRPRKKVFYLPPCTALPAWPISWATESTAGRDASRRGRLNQLKLGAKKNKIRFVNGKENGEREREGRESVEREESKRSKERENRERE